MPRWMPIRKVKKANSMCGNAKRIEALLPPAIFPAFAEYYGLNSAPNFEG